MTDVILLLATLDMLRGYPQVVEGRPKLSEIRIWENHQYKCHSLLDLVSMYRNIECRAFRLEVIRRNVRF